MFVWFICQSSTDFLRSDLFHHIVLYIKILCGLAHTRSFASLDVYYIRRRRLQYSIKRTIPVSGAYNCIDIDDTHYRYNENGNVLLFFSITVASLCPVVVCRSITYVTTVFDERKKNARYRFFHSHRTQFFDEFDMCACVWIQSICKLRTFQRNHFFYRQNIVKFFFRSECYFENNISDTISRCSTSLHRNFIYSCFILFFPHNFYIRKFRPVKRFLVKFHELDTDKDWKNGISDLISSTARALQTIEIENVFCTRFIYAMNSFNKI